VIRLVGDALVNAGGDVAPDHLVHRRLLVL